MKRLHGFSLMEMMIVLTIVAVVAAASAPMINKKLVRGASEKSPWVFVNGESIGYNIDNQGGIQDRKTATIGTNGRVPNGSNNPRLYIDTNSDTTPHILFGRQRGHLMRMIAGGDNDNVILSNDPQTSKNSVVIGPGTKASNDSQVVIGNSASSNSAHAISVGSYTEARAYDGIAIGHNAKVSSNARGSIAIGTSANTVTTGSVVIGSAKQNTGTSAVAIGYEAQAKGKSSVSIRGKSDGVFAIALGEGSNANTKESIAIGYQATASNNVNYPEDSLAGSTVLGAHAKVFGANTTAIGRSSNVSGYYSSAFGYNSHAEEPKALAIGANTVAKGENSTALGYNAKALAHNSTAIGYNAVATRDNTIVLGTNNDIVRVPGTLIPATLVLDNLHITGDLTVDKNVYLNVANKNTSQDLSDTTIASLYKTFMWIASRDKNRNSGLYSLQHRKLTDRHGILQISHSHDGNVADYLDSNQDIISPEAQSKIDDLNRRITELEAKQNRTLEATKKAVLFIANKIGMDMADRMYLTNLFK